jgi:hypothetical protein
MIRRRHNIKLKFRSKTPGKNLEMKIRLFLKKIHDRPRAIENLHIHVAHLFKLMEPKRNVDFMSSRRIVLFYQKNQHILQLHDPMDIELLQ